MTIAKETGWDRDYIADVLPYSEGLHIQTAILQSAGIATYSKHKFEDDILKALIK